MGKPNFGIGRAAKLGLGSPCASALVVLLALTGCGDGESGRYAISGDATFEGQPIPVGEVRFMPDTSKGNAGPGSVAPIKDGRYATPKGKGVVGGPYVIAVTGYEAAPSGPRDETAPDWGDTLFREYQITVELPEENSEHDIDVPAEAAG